jgi:hypothetical protein
VIETPSGKFEAVRVVREQSSGIRTLPTTRTTHWYAKDLGLVAIEGRTTLKSVSIPGR